MPGTLFVVATPIGNLEDITLRALRTLKEVDIIAAEDTRRTAKLLAHYEIRTPMVSLHEHNEFREAPRLVERLLAGKSIALVSDAGTPAIADPGTAFVAAARQAGVPVVPVPGPSAITAALSASGIPAIPFTFMGFVPRSGTERDDWFDRVASEPGAVVFFEAPHRIERTAGELAATLGIRQILWFRELTKIHEYSGLSPIKAVKAEAGEYVGVVEPAKHVETAEIDGARAYTVVGRLTEHLGLDETKAFEIAASILGADVRTVRKTVKKHKIYLKQQTRAGS